MPKRVKLIRATEARLPVPKMDSPIAPIRVDMHVDPNNRIRMDAFPAALQIGKSKGNAWDSCAGHNLFPFTNCFHSWDSVSRQYHVQGVSGSAASTGSGYTSIGFELDDSSIEWYDVHGLMVPGIREPLLSAVWFAKNLGIYTVIEDECFIRLPSGATIPCVTLILTRFGASGFILGTALVCVVHLSTPLLNLRGQARTRMDRSGQVRTGPDRRSLVRLRPWFRVMLLLVLRTWFMLLVASRGKMRLS